MQDTSPKAKRSARRSVYPRLWTAEEFLDWLQPGIHADLIGGQKYMHSPVNIRHSNVLNTVDRLLGSYVAQKGLGQVHRETIAVRFDGRDVFLPDLSYFTPEQVARLPVAYVPFAPTLVVEALSARTAKRDTGIKFAAYERHGVQEYWVLDPNAGEHRFYVREGDVFVEFARDEERIAARTIPGFYLLRAWLDPLNPLLPLDCLQKILGES